MVGRDLVIPSMCGELGAPLLRERMHLSKLSFQTTLAGIVAATMAGSSMHSSEQSGPPQSGPPLGLTPILMVHDARAAIDFYAEAFGARLIASIRSPDGSEKFIHVRMALHASLLVFMDQVRAFVTAGSNTQAPSVTGHSSATLHLQVENAHAVWEQAVRAGGAIVVPLEYQFWGEFYGRLRDPFGHEWTIAQMVDRLTVSDIEDAAKAMLSQTPSKPEGDDSN